MSVKFIFSTYNTNLFKIQLTHTNFSYGLYVDIRSTLQKTLDNESYSIDFFQNGQFSGILSLFT